MKSENNPSCFLSSFSSFPFVFVVVRGTRVVSWIYTHTCRSFSWYTSKKKKECIVMIVMICFIVHCVSSCTRVYLSTTSTTIDECGVPSSWHVFLFCSKMLSVSFIYYAIYQEPSSTGTTSKAVPQLLYVVWKMMHQMIDKVVTTKKPMEERPTHFLTPGGHSGEKYNFRK